MVVMMAALITSCKNNAEDVFENPYANGKEALGIKSNQQQVTVPAAGQAGTEVTIKATGLEQYYKANKLQFLFNGQKAEIKSVNADGLTVIVPDRASSGVTSFVVEGELVFGPNFTVLGKVNKDFTYKNVNGTDGEILRALEVVGGNTLLLGDFTNYDNKGVVRRINRIVRTLPDGSIDKTLQSGIGATGPLFDMAIVNSQWYIAGRFSGYAQRDGISNIARLSSAGQIDTVSVDTYEHKTKFVSRFNGGTNNTVQRIYNVNNKLVIAGNFTFYLSRRYDQPSYLYKDSVVIDSVDVRQFARLNLDGTLDKTYRFDANAPGYKGQLGRSYPGANGPVLGTVIHPDGKILAYGRFTTFDNANFGSIVRLKANGEIDETFNPGRAGTPDAITSVSYNATLDKYLVVGIFKAFNGTPVNSMVMLNNDGSIYDGFKGRVFEGGFPTYCKLLNDGLGIITGDFKSYDGAARNRFMISDLTGDLATGYNTIGNLSGYFNDVLETKSADNKRALLLVGSFSIFDNQPNFNIVRVTLE
jgi:WD40 repeat protein